MKPPFDKTFTMYLAEGTVSFAIGTATGKSSTSEGENTSLVILPDQIIPQSQPTDLATETLRTQSSAMSFSINLK